MEGIELPLKERPTLHKLVIVLIIVLSDTPLLRILTTQLMTHNKITSLPILS